MSDYSLDAVKKIIGSKRIPHAFLIEGDKGSGRHNLAHFLSKALLCESDNAPCGVCRQCVITENRSNADIAFICPEQGKKSISVEQIREMRSDAFIKPHSAKKRIFIIDGAELMTAEAQNALLKILEEPPKTVVFVLITASRTLLLNTVVSRCAPLSPLSAISKADNDKIKILAEEFLELLFCGKEYEMLKILNPLSKDRKKAEEFFGVLKTVAAKKLRENLNVKSKSRLLYSVFDNCNNYIDLLKTNINLSLLFSAAVSELKSIQGN